MEDAVDTLNEEGPCDICGSVGFAEKIATCHECKTSREHLYCFRKIVFAMPDMWVCEECEKFTHLANALVRYSSEKVHSQHLQGQDWGKFVVVDKETGIVKLRSCEEAGLLSSGDKSVLDTGFRTPLSTLSKLSKDGKCGSATRQLTCQIKDEKSPLAHFDKPFLKEEPLGTSTPAETITVEKGKQKRAFDCKAELFATPSPAKRVDTFSTSAEKRRMHVLKEELTDNSTSVKRVKTSISEMTTTVALSASKDALPFIGSEKNRLPNTLCRTEKGIPNYPAPESIWCWHGTIEIYRSASHKEFYPGFRAQFPHIIHKKAYEFSKQLPPVLAFTMVSSKFCLEIFRNDYPCSDSIALYFFPGNLERSERYFKLQLEMETQELALRSQFAGVELLVFPSKWLREDNLGLGPFLWGVYRPMKRRVTAQERNIKAEKLGCKVKVEQFNHLDGPPGFPGKIAHNYSPR